MDFSRLPDPVFLQIFQYLPFEDCFRAGRVSKIFRRIAQSAISDSKSLDLNEERFRKLDEDQFAVILDLCAPNLERIKFPSRDVLPHSGLSFDERKRRAAALDDQAQELAPIFCSYQCPRLTDIDLGHALLIYFIDRLVQNNPKMESLVWRASFDGFLDVTSNNLKKLNLVIDNDASLQSLIGRCPNLQEIDLNLQENTEYDDEVFSNAVTANVLDEFFASVPQLHRVSLQNDSRDGENLIRLESMLVNFWNLSLTSLSLGFLYDDYPDDNLLYKVARSFPNLQKFHLSTNVDPTDAAVACFGDLQELEVIELYFKKYSQRRYDQGIRQLARCKKLRKFDMVKSYISGGSFVHLFRSCSQLEHIEIWGMNDVDSSEEVAVILESLAGIPKRDIIISICSGNDKCSLWQDEPINVAIRMLEENHGLKIKKFGCWPAQE